MCACGTHLDAQRHQQVGVEEVVGDGLRQVEGKLDEAKGGTGVCRGENDAARMVHHGCVGG